MPRYRFSTKPLAPGAEAYVLDFQEDGVNWGTSNWSPLSDSITTTPYEFDLVHKRDVRFRLRVRDANGIIGTKAKYRVERADKPIQTAVPDPEVSVSQPGPSVVVDAPPPDGYETEVRVSDGAAAPEDALAAGTIRDGGCCGIDGPLLPDAEEMLAHARLVRVADGKRGPWVSVPIAVRDPGDWGSVEDHAADFSGGTIGTQGGKDTFVATSAGLEPLRLPRAYHTSNDANAYNATNSRRAYAPHPFPSECVYESPEFSLAGRVDFRLQSWPEVALTRGSIKAYSPTNRFPTRLPLSFERTLSDPEGYLRLMACRRRNVKAYAPSGGSADKEPPDVTQEVSVTQDGSTWSEYEAIRPGTDIVGLKAKYRLRVVPPHFGGVFVIPSWTVRRRRKNRKWEFRVPIDVSNGIKVYSFPVPPDVMDASSLVAVATMHDVTPVINANVKNHVRATLLDATQIRLVVTRQVSGQVTTSSGVVTWNYPAAFGATPRVQATPISVGHDDFAGHDTPGTTSTTIYTSPADRTVDVMAEGPPPADELYAHVVLTGY